MDPSEEEDLDNTALQILRLLGQAYVNLQEVQAVQEYVCEQYEASIRFVDRCSSQTSKSKDFRKISCQSSNGTSQAHEQRKQTTTVTGTDGHTIKQEQELAALCQFLDSVLATAQAVRERCNESTLSKGRGKVPGLHPVGVPGNGSSIEVSKRANKMDIHPAPLTVNKISKPNSRNASIRSWKSLKLRTSLVPGTTRPYNENQLSRKTSPIKQNDENSCLHLSARFKPPSVTVSTGREDLAIKSEASGFVEEKATGASSTGPDLKTTERWRLQFPEKYRDLRCWFEAREAYWFSTYTTSRIKTTAEEAFITLLDDEKNHQQDLSSDDYKNSTSMILELQNLMEDMASCTSEFHMLGLHRLAPAGSKVEEVRNFIVHNLLPYERKDGQMVTEPETDKLELEEVPNSSWLPEICWKHLCEVVSLSQFNELSLTELEHSLVTYSLPEQVVVIARLSHCIQVTLLHFYLERVFGPVLLHGISRKEEEQQEMTALLRCQLAHSVLCKEGRALFVLAERITVTA